MDAATLNRNVARPSAAHVVLAAASALAGVIHAAVVPEHLEEAWSFGTFFAILAVFQVGWAVWILVRPSPSAYIAGAVVNGAVMAIWLASRTVGLPVGPEPWMPEHVGVADAAATLAELLLLAGSLTLLRPAAPAADGQSPRSAAS